MTELPKYGETVSKAPLIAGVVVKPLKLIADERGYLMEMLRADDPFFTKLGQAYVSTTYPGVVKAWHYHKEQVDHFICIAGMVKLVLIDIWESSPTRGAVNEFFLGKQNRTLVVVPNLVHNGWKCISPHMSIVVNLPTELYRYVGPNEYRVEPHGVLPYDWTRKDG